MLTELEQCYFEDLPALRLMLDPFVPPLLDSSYKSYPDDYSVSCRERSIGSYRGFSELQNGGKYLDQLSEEGLLLKKPVRDIDNET